MLNGITRICCIAILLSCSLASHSLAGQWGPVWDNLAEQPGAKVEDAIHDGKETRNIRLPSGVSFYLTRNGGKITSVERDNTGLGAVMCTWALYVELRALFDACSPAVGEQVKAEFDRELSRIKTFIVENSITPVTAEQLEGQIASFKRRAIENAPKMSDEQRQMCKHFAAHEMTEEEREQSYSQITRLLSKKRPPVMNPCL